MIKILGLLLEKTGFEGSTFTFFNTNAAIKPNLQLTFNHKNCKKKRVCSNLRRDLKL